MLNLNKSLKRVYTNKLRYFLFKIEHLAMQADCTSVCERSSSSNELAKQKFLLQQVSLWNLFLLDISSSTASDCKAEDVRKHRHSDQSSWQENRSRIVKCWGGMMHKRLHCSADSVTVELQTSSITNISTQTVHRELCVKRFHGWAAAVVTQDFRPSFYVILI